MALLLITVARPNHRHVTKFLGLTQTQLKITSHSAE